MVSQCWYSHQRDTSEIYSDILKKEKIPHTVLNAKNHEKRLK